MRRIVRIPTLLSCWFLMLCYSAWSLELRINENPIYTDPPQLLKEVS